MHIVGARVFGTPGPAARRQLGILAKRRLDFWCMVPARISAGPRNRCRVFERPRAAQAPPGKAPRTTAPSDHSTPGPARIPTRPRQTSRQHPPGQQGPRQGPNAGPLATFPRQRDPLTASRPHQRTPQPFPPSHAAPDAISGPREPDPARRSSAGTRDHRKRRKP